VQHITHTQSKMCSKLHIPALLCVAMVNILFGRLEPKFQTYLLPLSSAMKTEAAHYSEKLCRQQTTWRLIPEDCSANIHIVWQWNLTCTEQPWIILNQNYQC